jgi:hypothetical protein
MIRALLILCLVFGQSTAKGPATIPGPATIGAAPSTFSLVQGPKSCSFSSTTSCTITLSSALAAGNLYAIMGYLNGPNPPALIISSISDGGSVGTLQHAVGCTGMTPSGVAYNPDCAYVLPSNATGGTGTSLTVNLSGTNGSGAGGAVIYEYHPSATPSLVGLDNDGAFATQVAAATQLGPAFTPSGTNNVTFQGWKPGTGFIDISSVSAPYVTNQLLTPANFGWSAAISTATPTWTSASSTDAIPMMMSFGFSPSACNEQGFNDFEGGTSGNTVTPALMRSSQHGWAGGYWSLAGTIAYSSTNMPLQNSSGRLCGDGATYASGAGSIGLVETGTGAGTANNVSYAWAQNANTSLTAGVWFCSDLVNTDTSSVDVFLIGTDASDFANITFNQSGSSRFFELETPAGNSTTINYSSGTGCGAGGTGWVNLQVQYKRSPAVASFAIFNTSGTQIGTTVTETTSGTNNPTKVFLGHIGTQTITSGKHNFWDSLKIDLTGAFPLTQ